MPKLISTGLSLLGRAALRVAGLELEVDPTASYDPRKVAAQRGCRLRIGAQSLVQGTLSFDKSGAVITIGARSFVNAHLVAADRIDIGDDVLMAWGSTVADHDSHSPVFALRANDVVRWARGEKDWSHVAHKPVRIGDKAWIGMHAIILKGVQVGEGAIVGAGSVVTRDVAPWTLVAGNPAKMIRALTDEEGHTR